MITDWLKQFYMNRCESRVKHIEHLKDQVVYLASFPHNTDGWMENFLEFLSDVPVYIGYTKQVEEEIAPYLKDNVSGLSLETNGKFFTKVFPKIAESKIIIADNYFPFLAALPKNDERIVVQVWHANGAIKKFGLEDPKNKNRSQKDNDRFKKVYQTFTHYAVGSETMGRIFQRSCGAKAEKILPFGFPRTDAYLAYSPEEWRQQFFELNPELQGEKLWLYAPTYRTEEVNYPLRKKQLEAQCGIKIIEHYHPHTIQQNTPVKGTMPMLLAAAEGLITDYSSLPFDYSLLRPDGRIVYYQYDLDEYITQFGLQEAFSQMPGGLIALDEMTLLHAIKEGESHLQHFNERWNMYNKGHATEHLAEFVRQYL